MVAARFCCCAPAFSSCGEWELLPGRFLLRSTGCRCWASVIAAPRPESAHAVVAVHGLVCPWACGISPDQGSNQRPLHWQVDSTTRPPGKLCRIFWRNSLGVKFGKGSTLLSSFSMSSLQISLFRFPISFRFCFDILHFPQKFFHPDFLEKKFANKNHIFIYCFLIVLLCF